MKPYFIPIVLWSVVAFIHVLLALPPATRDKSWKRFFIALILSFILITLPLFIFLTSVFLLPDWKGACHHGWLDCFHAGKIALLPLVLWGTGAMYTTEIYRTTNKTRSWIVLGVFMGAITSGVCLIIGVIIHGHGGRWDDLAPWLLVPLYVFVWYLLRSVQLMKSAGTTPTILISTTLLSSPLWIASVIVSRRYFAHLPETAPDCFIATAAARGHSIVVGPIISVEHKGNIRDANQQLLALWQLEAIWKKRASRSYAKFRSVYNVIGPVIASRITSPFAADVAYTLIKPVEMLARLILKLEKRRSANIEIERDFVPLRGTKPLI